MADPQRELAPIVEPVAPATAPGVQDMAPVGIGAAIVALLLVLVLAWVLRWRRQAPLRRLRRLPESPDPIAAANELAALLHRHGVVPDAAWAIELEVLRFGPRADDARTTLARLCGEAESVLRGKL